MMLKLPSFKGVLLAVCWGILLSSLPAALIGWRTAAIYEAKLDQIYVEAELNGGAVVVYLDDIKRPVLLLHNK